MGGPTVSWVPNRDHLMEHFKVWYRTPASTVMRNLWAKIPGGLPKGSYTLGVPVNAEIWGKQWAVTKRVVISTTSSVGGKHNFLPTIYIVAGSYMLFHGLVLAMVPGRQREIATE